MTETPPPFHPFDDGASGGWLQPAEPAAATPPAARRFAAVWLVALGLAVGVVATVLVTHLTGSGSPSKQAAAVVTATNAAPATSAATPSAVATTPKPTPKVTKSKAPAKAVVLPAALDEGLTHAGAVEVRIPKIAVDSRLVSLGLQKDGTLQVPTDYSKAGWYSQGAYPGDANEPPAIIAGHVDNYKGPAVFFKLSKLVPGDSVQVVRADGSVAYFVVYKTANYLKTQFPSSQVYATSSRPELRLITCTGTFNTSDRSYLSNFVAYAYLVSSS